MLFLLIGPIVIWRMTHMMQEENGPFAVFARIRAFIASHTSDRVGGVNEGYNCFKCLSVWLSMLYAVGLSDSFAQWVAITFFLSGIAIFLNLAYNKIEQT